MQSVLSDYGIFVEVKLLSDATAAIGMARWQGLGRVRHLATSDLWIQQRIRLGHLSVAKWPGKNNPADILTKHKSRDELSRLMEFLGLQVVPGRPEPAPLRSTGWNISQVVAVKTEKRLLTAQPLEVRSTCRRRRRCVCVCVCARPIQALDQLTASGGGDRPAD